jgi:hypothetical protein
MRLENGVGNDGGACRKTIRKAAKVFSRTGEAPFNVVVRPSNPKDARWIESLVKTEICAGR